MRLGTFKGGVHPYDGKEFSKDKPIQELWPKGDMVYSLSEHIGMPAKPIVAVGDYVQRGQEIACAQGNISAHIHSAISGTVKALEKRDVVYWHDIDTIVIENDGEFKTVDFVPTTDTTQLSKEDILCKIKEGGIVGLGGAGFPTYVKLSPKNSEKIDYIIANGAECEPYLTTDYRNMLENAEKIVGGLKIVLQLFDNAKGVIAIEDNKPDCIEKMKDLVKDEPRIQVQSVTTKYPQGGERQLMVAVTGRKIYSKLLPADIGCIVNNVGTFLAIYNAVKLGIPLIDRLVTVTGSIVKEPGNYLVPLGIQMQELLDEIGGFTEEPAKIVSGGPMMGFALYHLDMPVTKTTSSILALTAEESKVYEVTPCINCARCVEYCPTQLVPARLADYGERGLDKIFEKWHGLECIECGTCSYVCPARRHLKQSIQGMKRNILKKGVKSV